MNKLPEDLLRQLFMVEKEVTADKESGAVSLGQGKYRDRYWSKELNNYRGKKVFMHYDPEDLFAPVHVYTKDRRLITTEAKRFGAVGFYDIASGKEHLRLARQIAKNAKAIGDAYIRQAALEQQQLFRAEPQLVESPAAKVIGAPFGVSRPAKPKPEIDRAKMDQARREINHGMELLVPMQDSLRETG